MASSFVFLASFDTTSAQTQPRIPQAPSLAGSRCSGEKLLQSGVLPRNELIESIQLEIGLRVRIFPDFLDEFADLSDRDAELLEDLRGGGVLAHELFLDSGDVMDVVLVEGDQLREVVLDQIAHHGGVLSGVLELIAPLVGSE